MSGETGAGKRHVVDVLFTLALFCVFAASCLIVVYIGSNVYGSTVRQAQVSFEVNTPLTYVATKIREHDAQGSVHIGQLGGHPALVLEQTLAGQTFQTWIYHHDGALRELFVSSANASSITPGAGQELMRVHEFSAGMAGGRLIYISARSEGGVYAHKLVALRSG